MNKILSGMSNLSSYLSFIFLRKSSFSRSLLIGGGFGNGVLFSANRSSSFLRAWSLGAPGNKQKYSCFHFFPSPMGASLTWRVAFNVAHLDQPVGGLLDVVVAVGEDVQEQVLLHRRKDTLQVPENLKNIVIFIGIFFISHLKLSKLFK